MGRSAHVRGLKITQEIPLHGEQVGHILFLPGTEVQVAGKEEMA